MFRLHKTKPAAKSGERIDFKFSQFKVHQVPKGWDKLFVSVISVETGKTIAKTSKAAVKNGNCQWIDTVSESIWIASQDGQSSKELEDCPYKLLVAMGSARSGMLGEAILNMATYMNSSDSVPVSFPLKKCNHGTILQLKIQCVTPRTNIRIIRDAESKGTNSSKEDIDADSKNSEIKSEESDNSIAKGSRSYSSRDLGSLTHQGDQGRQGGGEAVQDTSFPVSDSHHSYNSEEISLEREEHNLTAGQESTSSKDSVPPRSSNADNASQSSHSSFNSRITHSDNLSQDEPQEFAALSLKISDSSKSLLEAAEDTIEELRGEAKMWERNARKLMLDLELVRKEYSEQSKNQLNLAIELSAACAERDGLQKEVEQLKLLLEKTMKKPSGLEDLELQDTGVNRIIKELENEIKYQKESNANLTLQLNRSQESNAELVSVLQELEATVEKQKAEIKNDQAAEKNQDLVLQMQQLQESEKFLQAKVQELEKVLENKNQNLENASLSDQILVDIETEYESKLSAKEKETVSLKAKLSDTQKQRHCLAESKSADEAVGNLMEEIESLKAKLQELESDCQELTEENLELLVRLKEMKKNSAEEGVSLTATRFEVSDNDPEEKVREKVLKEIETDHNLSIQELENLKLHLEHKVNELSRELSEKGEVIERLDAGLLSKEEQIENLHRYQRELEEKFSSLQKEKSQLEENMEIVSGESDIAMKCMNALQKDLTVLSSSVNNHVSANKVLERKTSEIESSKRELEIHLSELEQENEELSACIAVMEAQIRNLTDDRESIELELENSKSNAVIIQDEIARLRNETETQKRDAKQKLEEMKNRWSEAEEELEHLRSANPKLQATAESLMEECSLLQKSNGELKMRKLELEGQCNHLETKLRESHRSFSDCSKRVSVLQESICSLLEQSASKERSLSSELDALLKENEKQNKKLSVVNEMYMEKMVLVENLQQEIGDLTKKLSATQNERERITSDAANEVSKLRENVAKVESELNTVNIEFKIKIQGLTNELASSKESQEMLKADNGKMLKLLENYRSREENFKTTLNGLELNLTVSEYERQQLMEECKNLKAQLQKIESLEDEVLALKNELKAIKSEKEKLGTSLRLKSEECEELKTEKILCIDKITELQKEVSELEDCKQDKFALQEKLQQLESDLIAKEALCEQDAELKNQLNRIKRTNKQLQQQHQQLEEEKQKCRTRAQSLEEELIMMKDKQRSLRESRSVNSISNQHQRELLEDEVSKSVEVNNGYKPQVKRLTSEGRKGWTGSPRKSKAEGEFVPKEKFERTKSSLEAELRDIRERYFHMSLKYAEVEEEREELVMKLKAANSGKGWF